MKSEFKKFSELTELDAINSCWVFANGKRLTIKDIYDNIALINLDSTVPMEIVTQFDVAKNLAVYSGFVYRFHQPAKMQAYSTLEFALKDVLGIENKKSKGLNQMIKDSLELGLITEKSFSFIRDVSKDKFSKILLDTVPYFRNNIAHGSSTLSDDSPNILTLCSNLINEMYKNKGLVKKPK